MKNTYQNILFFLCTLILLFSCKKESINHEISLANELIAEKTWFLDYNVTGNSKKIYEGQSSYFIVFRNNKETKDSDGLLGTYSIEQVNKKLQIRVQAKTNNLSNIEYLYNIESIGAQKMILSYIKDGTTTQLFFTNK